MIVRAAVGNRFGGLMATPSTDELLERRRPVLERDSQEACLAAHSSPEWTDAQGNVLWRAMTRRAARGGLR
jgi:hypothetical protein